MALTIESPSPVPFAVRVLVESSCPKRLKSLGWSSVAMPMPVSATSQRKQSATISARKVTVPPSGVNLMALLTRFVTTCPIRCASASIIGRPARTWLTNRRFFRSTAGARTPKVEAMSSAMSVGSGVMENFPA